MAATINLNNLLRLTFTEKSIWLSGNPTDENLVRWVITDLETPELDDLFLVNADIVNSDLLEQAEKKKVAAILIVGTTQPVSNFENTPIPCIYLPTNKTLSAIQRELLATISNSQTLTIKREVQIHEQLTQLVADNVKIDGLARAMHQITSRGILVHNKRLDVIAECPSADLQSAWADITSHLSTATTLPLSLQNRKNTGKHGQAIHQNIATGISRIIAPIIVSNMIRGYLSIIGPENKLDSLDHLVTKQGALICAVEMAHAKEIRQKEKLLQSDLLNALLQEDISPREANLWIEAMELDETMAHVALQFAWDGPNPPSQRRLETIINSNIARLGLKVALNPTGKKVICFCQLQPEMKKAEGALALATQVLAQIQEEYPDTPARCGIGTHAPTLMDWHQSFSEAGQALDMAFRLNESKPLYYPDLSVFRLLLLLESTPELLTFQEDTLGILLEQKEKETLLETLEAFFAHSGNLSQTAKALFIHRNTLSYRLEKISEITSHDLNNPDTALTLQLALKTYRMLQK